MKYSPSTGGFYTAAIHGDNIPADAVEITTERHAALIAGQSQGKRIVAGASGVPALQDPPPPTEAEVQEAQRAAGVDQAIKDDAAVQAMKPMSNAEFDAWWAANVTTLAQANNVLKRLARVVVRRLL
jgi:hypothetical protein